MVKLCFDPSRTTQGPEHPLLPFPALLEGLAKGKRDFLEVAEEQNNLTLSVIWH